MIHISAVLFGPLEYDGDAAHSKQEGQRILKLLHVAAGFRLETVPGVGVEDDDHLIGIVAVQR